jgi:hypothetical protein
MSAEGGNAAGMDKVKADEYQHDRGRDERGDGGDSGDHAHGREGVGVEQQAAQRLALEQGRGGGGQLGVAWAGQSFRADLGVGLAAADLDQVIADEVVGVGLRKRISAPLSS